MAKAKESYGEIDNIRDDLKSLKTDVIKLSRHVQEDSVDKTVELAKKASQRLATLKSQGQEKLDKIERRIKTKPAQSLAIAFAAGFVVHHLLGRRGSH
jgi:ElaB/YqjD/DUF883 family membrane-anchored ribosome-binding protein